MTKPIDLESARHIRDANETMGDIVDMMNEMTQEQLYALNRKEVEEIVKNDPTITLGEGSEEMDAKDIYLRTKIGVSDIYSIVGLHAVGYAGPYTYTLVGLDESRTEITTNFNALETWGNEYDDEHNMLGRGSFRLHSNDIESYAKQMESEGWERYEGPKRK